MSREGHPGSRLQLGASAPLLGVSDPLLADRDEIVVRLGTGRSARREVVYSVGEAAPLLAVGTRAGWSIVADGLAAVHAVLAFNGRTLYACSQGGAILCVDGRRVRGHGWICVPSGATLELGSARLVVLTRSKDDAATAIPSPPSAATRVAPLTVRPRAPSIARGADAVTLSAETEAPPAESNPRASAETAPPSSAATRVRDREAVGRTTVAMPAPQRHEVADSSTPQGDSFGTTRIVPPMGAWAREASARREVSRTPGLDAATRSVETKQPPSGTTRAMDVAAELEAGRRTVAMPVHVLPPSAAPAVDSFGTTRMVPPMGVWSSERSGKRQPSVHADTPPAVVAPLFPRAAPSLIVGPSGGESSPTGRSSESETPIAMTFSAATAHGVADAERQAGAAVPARPRVRRTLDELRTAWRGSSPVKKGIALLIAPLLIVATMASWPGSGGDLARAPATKDARTEAAPASAPAPVSGPDLASVPVSSVAQADAGAAQAVAAPDVTGAPIPPTVRAAPPPRGGSGKAKERTPERRALDAAAAGEPNAAEAYDALARSQPENPAFAEAARILRTKRE